MELLSVAENHEPCVVALEQPLQELHADACESVAVGHHNFCDSAATDGVQKGEKTRVLPVEPAVSVFDELMVGVGAFEIIALTLEVGVLVGTADAGVANATPWLRFFAVETDLTLQVFETVELLAFPAMAPDHFDLVLVSPATKSA